MSFLPEFLLNPSEPVASGQERGAVATWTAWRSALYIVKPDTVIAWLLPFQHIHLATLWALRLWVLSLLQPLEPVVTHQLTRVRGTNRAVAAAHIIGRTDLLASPADAFGSLGMYREFSQSLL